MREINGVSSGLFAVAGLDQARGGAVVIGAVFVVVSIIGLTACLVRDSGDGRGTRREDRVRG